MPFFFSNTNSLICGMKPTGFSLGSPRQGRPPTTRHPFTLPSNMPLTKYFWTNG